MRKENIQIQNDIMVVYVDKENNFWFYHRDVSEKLGLNWKGVYNYINQNISEKEQKLINLRDFEEEYYGHPHQLTISISAILQIARKFKVENDNEFLNWVREIENKNKNQITKIEEEEHLLMKVDENEITKEEPNVKENNDTINNSKDDDDQFKKLCDEVFRPIITKYKEKEEENVKLKNVLKHIKDMIEEIL